MTSPENLAFAQFIKDLKLSNVKELLLKELWGSSDGFPKQWVKSSVLLAKSNQKYFDRRLRELRDSAGIDIETKHIEGEHCWRLNSANIGQVNDRTYLTNSQKKLLFNIAGNKCRICGKVTLAGIRGLQADHKIPLIRGGTNELSNWQALCNECNVAKRGVCKDCDLDCNTCTWAVPEKTGFNFVIKIPSDLKYELDKRNLKTDTIENLLIARLKDYISHSE